MRRTSKLFLIGVGSAIAIGLFANYRAGHWKVERTKAMAMCQTEAKLVDSKSTEWWAKDERVSFPECNAYRIADFLSPSPVQQKILDAANAVSRWETVLFTMIFLGILSAIPALWYFLLDRLREVAGAFRSGGRG